MNMMGRFFPASGWTPENIATLTRMWADGRSASDIAREIGDWCNRNKVIGKAYRLGLGEHANARNQSLVARRQRAAEKRRKPSPRPVGAKKPVSPAPEPPVAFGGASDVPWVALSILHVTDATAFRPGRCKWPVNESGRPDGHLFCGGHTFEGSVYCNTHNAAAYAPVPARQKFFPVRR